MTMKAPTIILMTDFGYEDSYAAQMKGVICSIFPHANLVDLTHGIPPQDIRRGALTLLDAFRYFPPGSIFVCVVDPGVGTDRRILCAKSRGRFFIGPDNGLLSLALETGSPCRVRNLENKKFFRSAHPSGTFHGRDIMAPLAARLARSPSGVFKEAGPLVENWVRLKVPGVKRISNRSLTGEILFFDHYGNAVTNIQRSDAREGFWNRSRIFAGTKTIGKIHGTYASGVSRQPRWTALFNSAERLEIAQRGGSAKRGGLGLGQKVRAIA